MKDTDSVPKAPAFCQRVSPQEAEMASKQATADELLKLGAKIQSNINTQKETSRTQNLKKLSESVQISELLTEYFDLDETSQKSRLLDMLTENSKQTKIIQQYKTILDSLQKKYEEEKQHRQDISEQCDSYLQEIDDLEKEVTTLTGRAETAETHQQTLTTQLEKTQDQFNEFKLNTTKIHTAKHNTYDCHMTLSWTITVAMLGYTMWTSWIYSHNCEY